MRYINYQDFCNQAEMPGTEKSLVHVICDPWFLSRHNDSEAIPITDASVFNRANLAPL